MECRGKEEGSNRNGTRLQVRLWQLEVSVITLLVTAWACTLGILPAILALLIAKHVLVAVLVVGCDRLKSIEDELVQTAAGAAEPDWYRPYDERYRPEE